MPRHLLRKLLLAFTASTLGACLPVGQAARNATDEEKAATIREMYTEYKQDFPDVRDLTVEELDALRDKDNPVLVDARTEKEQAVSMIPGAITREHYEAHRSEYQGRPVITYCTIGYRSGEYAEELSEEGVDAWNLAGSILAWTHAGKALVTPDGKTTKRVHVYGRKWDLVAEGYETTW